MRVIAFRYLAFPLIALLGGLIVPASRAQTAGDGGPATPLQLVVTFGETVPEARARALMERLGYPVRASYYNPVRVWASSSDAPAPEALESLRASPGVRAVEVHDLAAGLAEAAKKDTSLSVGRLLRTDGMRRFQLNIVLADTVASTYARLLVERLPGVRIELVSKPPNELLIGVPFGTVEDAARRLTALPEVTGVSKAGRPRE